MKKKIEVFKDIENMGGYYVGGVDTPSSALVELELEYPDTRREFNLGDVKEVFMSECLDCKGCLWVDNGDRMCGECGESRLSKRTKRYWNIDTINNPNRE